MNRANIVKAIETAVENEAEISDIQIAEINEKTPIYGPRGYFDSLGLVSLLASIEDSFAERGINLTIASDRAFSRKISPFLSVRTLANFLEEIINEK
jgi:acyl carrier protein